MCDSSFVNVQISQTKALLRMLLSVGARWRKWRTLWKQAKAKRELAARARRWAKDLPLTADKDRLEQIAEDLEREAAELERQAATEAPVPPPSCTVIQMQWQSHQQQQTHP
jgi:hypothetical protein